MMTIEEIRLRKRLLGYTNARLSELTGVPAGTVNKILCGATKHPRVETMKALERVLQDPECFTDAAVFMDDAMVGETTAPYGKGAPDRSGRKQPGEFTINDYYMLPEDQRVELIDGVLYDMAAPTVEHQLLTGSVYAQIAAFIRRKKGKCVPLVSPVDVKLDADDKTMVQPDVAVVCDKKKIADQMVLGGPDFVLEVVSHSSVIRDYVKKAFKYEAAGVREYWIVDPLSGRVLTYDFSAGTVPGVYPLSGKIGVGIFDQELQIDFDEYREFL